MDHITIKERILVTSLGFLFSTVLGIGGYGVAYLLTHPSPY